MVHDGSSHSALATPPARPPHALRDALSWWVLNSPNPAPFASEPKAINAGARVFFGVVSALAGRLDLALTPFSL